MRNPARTAVTSSALMIGLAIVVFVTVFADGLKTGIGNAISQGARGNLVLQSSGLTRIPGRVVPLVAGTPGVATASALYTDRIKLPDGSIYGMVGIDPATFDKVWNMRWIDGSDATLGRLGQTGFILDKDSAKSLHLRVGRTVAVEGLTGRRERLTLRGIYNGQNSPLGGFVVPGPAVRPHLDQPRRRCDPGPDRARRLGGDRRGDRVGANAARRPDRRRADHGGVHREPAGPAEPGHLSDLRPALDERRDQPVRDREHARAVRVRAHPRDRHAAGDRPDPPADAADGALRERDHLADRGVDRNRGRALLRLGDGARACRARGSSSPSPSASWWCSSCWREWPACWPPSCRPAAPRA